jgi:hypothetical protein
MDNMTTKARGTDVVLSPMCREIRSKKVFHLTSIPMTPDDVIDLSNHCWCRVTQQVVGPDGNRVHPTTCTSDRSCYKSHFE